MYHSQLKAGHIICIIMTTLSSVQGQATLLKRLPVVIGFQKRLIRYSNVPIDVIYGDIINGKRAALAHAITLVESTKPEKRLVSETLLSRTLKRLRSGVVYPNKSETSFRIGLTGPPGAGKSTLIESLGKYLTSIGHRVAVLAVDPSSAKTGGSLLGDRTRMTELSRDENAYIRPSPSSGTLGKNCMVFSDFLELTASYNKL